MIAESLYNKIDIPNVSLWQFLFERQNKPFPDDKVIFLDPYTRRSYTYSQTRKVALDFAQGLKANYEWRKGDVLGLFTPNCIDTPAIMWGCLWTGGVVSPANPAYSADELAFQLKDSKAKALITQWDFLPTARQAAQKAGIPEDNIILIGDKRDPSNRVKHFSSVQNISGAAKFRRAPIKPKEDLAFLVYSSGTTGLPKGVMLTHQNIVANTLQSTEAEVRNLSSEDSILAFLPFFHIYGLTILVHQSFYNGLLVAVMPRFDIEDFCKIVQRDKITFAYVAPPVVLLLSKNPIVDKYDLSSLRMMNSGAAPLTRELVDSLWSRKKLKVKQGYGLSEASPTTHVQLWEDWHSTIGSVGKLLPNMIAKYMNAEEKEVAVGQVGELWLKGPNIFKGYLNNPEGTRNCLTDDGWFKTGDVGYQDKDGNFYITDRVKELIKYKGFQVAPAELEGYIAAHTKVDDVAVVGIYRDDLATEVPRAYIVPAQGSKPNKELADELVKYIAAKVANHKHLRGGVRFVDAIPKSASGKILRRILKQQAAEEQATVLKAKL